MLISSTDTQLGFPRPRPILSARIILGQHYYLDIAEICDAGNNSAGGTSYGRFSNLIMGSYRNFKKTLLIALSLDLPPG
jgi:hypothetical protein